MIFVNLEVCVHVCSVFLKARHSQFNVSVHMVCQTKGSDLKKLTKEKETKRISIGLLAINTCYKKQHYRKHVYWTLCFSIVKLLSRQVRITRDY